MSVVAVKTPPGSSRSRRAVPAPDGATARGGGASASGAGGDARAGVGVVTRECAASFERERIVEIQRARILGAATRAVCELGGGGVSVASIVERAGVSRRTFYEEFTDAEDCILAALDRALEYVRERVEPAYVEGVRRWRERIRGSLAQLLCLFDEQPLLARLLVVESLSAGRGALEHRARVLASLTGIVDEGRGERPDPAGVAYLTAEGIVGAVLSVIHTRLIEGMGEASPDLSRLLNPLMSAIVLPYLGAAQAKRELDMPQPEHSLAGEHGAPLQSDPFKDAGMRLTYRTMLVLSVIAANPGASNRQIGDIAGVNDQGQMSKLLARLERIGLIAKPDSGHMKGEPNSWSLTAEGRQVAQGLRMQTNSTSSRLSRETQLGPY